MCLFIFFFCLFVCLFVTVKSGYGQGDVPDKIVEIIHDKLVEVLPISHYCLLKEIVVLFNSIVEHCSTNKMTQNNLFIVIIPTLQCAPSLLALAMEKTDVLLCDNMFTIKAPAKTGRGGRVF